jgi:colanic acid biosynthesis glycosyl transferase WcaI
VFAPDSVSTAYIMTDLARQLEQMGHTVTVLTTTPHYNHDQSAMGRQPLRPIWHNVLYQSVCDGMSVWHVKVPMKKGQRISSRSLDFMRFHAWSLFVGAFMLNRYDIVITPSPPLTIGIIAWLLGLRWRVPSVYNVQEVYPDFAINQGAMRNPAMRWLMRWIERVVYRRSTMLVPISERFRHTIAQRGVPGTKLRVIPNFADTDFYRPLPRDNDFARQHGLLDDFVVLYGGNIGVGQDWETLLAAAQALRNHPITFVITGDGVCRTWLLDEIQQRTLHNVRFLGYLPLDSVPYASASSDIGTIPMKKAATRDIFPSKIYAMMACGKPAIVAADADSELVQVVQQAQCGRVVPPEDPPAYTEAVYRAFQERDRLPAEGARGRQFVEQHYSKEAVAHQYDELIRHLVE